MLTRRATFGVAAMAAAGGGPAQAAPTQVPPGFLWGVANSAPQTESAAGRGESIWDVFARQPGAIADGSNLSVCNRFEQDYETELTLAANAGLTGFRFSIAWPRVQPISGQADAAGLAFYDRLVDAMLAHRLQPWPTIFHWDLPSWVPGGWLNRDTAQRLADYAVLVGRRLGDRVPAFMVLNEPGVVAIMGHALGQHAPGLRSRPAWAAATHHQNLAQGLAIQALRGTLRTGIRLGNAYSLQPCVPAAPGAEEAAAIWDDAWNRAFLDPVFGRGYPARFQADLSPLIRRDDMRIIASRPDFLGVNYYDRMHMIPGGSVLGATWGPSPPGTPANGLGWPIEPGGLLQMLRILRDSYGNPDVWITENGTTFPDPAPSGGIIADPQRIAFLRAHLQAAAQACAEGCRLHGYFCWTLADNFEWAEGFRPSFGLVHVDRPGLQRIPKQSLSWFGACARANAVT